AARCGAVQCTGSDLDYFRAKIVKMAIESVILNCKHATWQPFITDCGHISPLVPLSRVGTKTNANTYKKTWRKSVVVAIKTENGLHITNFNNQIVKKGMSGSIVCLKIHSSSRKCCHIFYS